MEAVFGPDVLYVGTHADVEVQDVEVLLWSQTALKTSF